MMLPREKKELIEQKINYLKTVDICDDANFKFLTLFHTRLVEEGIPVEEAYKIASYALFDFSGISEEDDFLSQMATMYAEYCAKVYSLLKAYGFHRHLDAESIRRFFNYNSGLKVD